MSGFLCTILLFLIFVIVMSLIISSVKRRQSVYLIAITATLSAWFIGLVLDANIHLGLDGAFRILLPILAMGLCILNVIMKNKPD